MMRLGAALLMIALCIASPASAQRVPVTAGEHPTFTRVVISIPSGLAWSHQQSEMSHSLSLASETALFDIGALFTRIPRTRLSDARVDGSRLDLILACPCPLRVWEERPGLIVLDISDPPMPPASAPVRQTPVDTVTIAQNAGESLARLRPGPVPPVDPLPPPALGASEVAALTADLGAGVAQALGQGILEPAVSGAAPPLGVLPGAVSQSLADNMRVMNVQARSSPESARAMPPATECQGAEGLDALIDRASVTFAQAYRRLSQSLYGEFDHPEPEAQRGLITLYLASGFGAEARALIENSTEPFAGRDFALGFSDVLEGRRSNSRMRLARAIDCGGVVALAAVLAGADTPLVASRAESIALTFTRLPPELRAVLGLDLVRAMVETQSLNAARIIFDSLRESPWTDPDDALLSAASMARARGNMPESLIRLSSLPASNPAGWHDRLDLALETHSRVADDTLDDAESVAAASRNDGEGAAMMERIIRLRSRGDRPETAFAALDRLESWLPRTSENHRFVADLRDDVWSALARRASDLAFVEAVLSREDWRGTDINAATRRALAGRLIDLGFPEPGMTLVADDLDSPGRVLQGRAALAMGSARQALDLALNDTHPDARALRAAAHSNLGDYTAAAVELASLGETDEAIRAAVLAGDWRLVERLRAQDAAPALAGQDIDALLGRAPGHAEALRIETGSLAPSPPTVPAPPPTSVGAFVRDRDASASTGPDSASAPISGLLTNAPPTARAPIESAPESTSGIDPALTPVQPALVPQDEYPVDPASLLNRMGMVQRSSMLMAESQRLRDAVADLIARQP